MPQLYESIGDDARNRTAILNLNANRSAIASEGRAYVSKVNEVLAQPNTSVYTGAYFQLVGSLSKRSALDFRRRSGFAAYIGILVHARVFFLEVSRRSGDAPKACGLVHARQAPLIVVRAHLQFVLATVII